MRIGIFDSGIGGLTVLKSIVNKYPNHQYFYFGDTINLPYGEKTKEQLMDFSNKIINFLLEKKVDIIIIACGTISSNIYRELKDKYNIQILDIITPTIDYINNSNYKKIGVIGTNMTIGSKVFENEIEAEVISQACPMFVPLIEENKINTEEFEKYINLYLKKLKEKRVESIILGCTHYPIIKKQIRIFFDYNVDIIDLGEIISNKIDFKNEDEANIELYFSKISNNLFNNVQNITGDYKIIEKRL